MIHNRFLQTSKPSVSRPSCHAILGQTWVAHHRCHLSPCGSTPPPQRQQCWIWRGRPRGRATSRSCSLRWQGRWHIPRQGTQCRSHEINMQLCPMNEGTEVLDAVSSAQLHSPHRVRVWHCEASCHLLFCVASLGTMCSNARVQCVSEVEKTLVPGWAFNLDICQFNFVFSACRSKLQSKWLLLLLVGLCVADEVLFFSFCFVLNFPLLFLPFLPFHKLFQSVRMGYYKYCMMFV